MEKFSGKTPTKPVESITPCSQPSSWKKNPYIMRKYVQQNQKHTVILENVKNSYQLKQRRIPTQGAKKFHLRKTICVKEISNVKYQMWNTKATATAAHATTKALHKVVDTRIKVGVGSHRSDAGGANMVKNVTMFTIYITHIPNPPLNHITKKSPPLSPKIKDLSYLG